MKKYFVILLLLLIVPISFNAESKKYVDESLEKALKSEEIDNEINGYSNGENKITVYLFRGQGCGHCKHFLEYVSSELVKTHGDYFNFVSYEVWKNSDNKELWQNVAKSLGLEQAKGVPFIVIGDKYFVGYSERINDSLKEAITSLYETSQATGDKNDVVKKVIENGVVKVSGDENTENDSDKSNNAVATQGNNANAFRDDNENKIFNKDLIIKVVVSVVSALLAVLLIVFLRKKKIIKE